MAGPMPSMRLSWSFDRCVRRRAYGRGNLSSVSRRIIRLFHGFPRASTFSAYFPRPLSRFISSLLLSFVLFLPVAGWGVVCAEEEHCNVKVLVAYHSLSGNTE